METMKYVLLYDVNGIETYYGFTERLDLNQLLQLIENAVSEGIDIFRISVFGRGLCNV